MTQPQIGGGGHVLELGGDGHVAEHLFAMRDDVRDVGDGGRTDGVADSGHFQRNVDSLNFKKKKKKKKKKAEADNIGRFDGLAPPVQCRPIR